MKKLIIPCIVLLCSIILSGCGNPHTNIVKDFYTAVRSEDFGAADKYLAPGVDERLRNNRAVKKVFASVRLSKTEKIEVVKRVKKDGSKISVIKVTVDTDNATLFFVIAEIDGVSKITDISEDAYHVSY
jgi:hypothetical protein